MLEFRIARERREFELIHALNHRTFAEEIPQHPTAADGRLVDRFHDDNIYLICMRGERLAGMVAVNGKRPFSLDTKLGDLDAWLPLRNPCEVRLLAVEREFRSGRIFAGLARLLREHAARNGFDGAVISGTTRQLKLYANIGFVPFGPLVGSGEALFQPMYLTTERYDRRFGRGVAVEGVAAAASAAPRPPEAGEAPAATQKKGFALLPGPVAMSEDVRRAFAAPARSHRGAPFLESLDDVRRRLCALTNAAHAAVALGSGTLANDMIAGQLAALGGRGVVVSNGEFGERLADHASRAGLRFGHVRFDWGAPFDRSAVARAASGAAWLWFVHCETSTGVVNDFASMRTIASGSGARLCADCISSVGLLPLDLRGVFLASGVSGKALASFPGLALVFHDHEIATSPSLPRYLDLGLYARPASVPFTHSSNLVEALRAALADLDVEAKRARLEKASVQARRTLRALGFALVADDAHAAPGVITISLPQPVSSLAIGAALEGEGCLLSYRSDYLVQRNWLQLCFMTDEGAAMVGEAIEALGRVNSPHAVSPLDHPQRLGRPAAEADR